MEENERTLLKESIQSAFKSVPYPGDNNLVREHSVLYSGPYKTLSKLLSGKRWNDLTLNIICSHLQYYHKGLTLEGFRYFLPGIIIIAVDSFDKMGNLQSELIWYLMPEQLINSIFDKHQKEDDLKILRDHGASEGDNNYRPEEIPEESEEFYDRFAGLNMEQKYVILSFLRYIKSHYSSNVDEEIIDSAISVWEQLCKENSGDKGDILLY